MRSLNGWLIFSLLNFFSMNVIASESNAAEGLSITPHLPFSLQLSDNEIFQNPLTAYQRLMEHKESVSQWNNAQQRWWFVRKAQCENLLYFYKKFDGSLAQLDKLINVDSSNEITARFFYFKGLSSQRKGAYQQARTFYKQSMELAKALQLTHLYIKAKQEYAYSYSLSELYETSLADMQEAFIAAFALDDQFLVAVINETYGAIYGYMREYQQSIEYYEKALATYEKLGYQSHVAEAIFGLATTYRYWGKHDLAIEKFKLYNERIFYTPNTNLSYFSSYGLGMTLAEKGDCKEALKVINYAFTIEGVEDYDAELYKKQASCLIKFKQFSQAENALKNAEIIFAKMPELDGTAWVLEINKIRGQLAFAKGLYQKAYLTLEQYYLQYANVLIENSSRRVANIRASMELERQEIEKALSAQRNKTIKLEHEKQEQKSLQQSYFIIFLITALLVVLVVLTFQYRNNRRMKALTITDSLSGLYNRRYTFDYLEKVVASTSPEKGELCVLVLDIDNFKRINDNYGHPFGDEVIKQVAHICQQCLRAGDLIGRIGGEEFLCILPRADQNQGKQIADRMRTFVAKSKFSAPNADNFQVSISIGFTTIDISGSDVSMLYTHADKALYQAKNSGKNSVTLYKE